MKHSHDELDDQGITLSCRIYRYLLALYPAKYRREYGGAMAQLFRDQCREAWGRGGGCALGCLWLRLSWDLVRTLVLEHISTLKERKSMTEKLNAMFANPNANRRVFVRVFVAVFLLVVMACTVITFLMPEFYSSTARVKLEQTGGEAVRVSQPPTVMGSNPYFIQTQFELIVSDKVLAKVVEELQLNEAWGKKYGGGAPLRTVDTIAILKRQIELRSVRNTSLIEIRAFSGQASEAAKVANAIAQAYQELNPEKGRPEIVDTAVAGRRPVRPNKPMNIVMGVLAGSLLALVAGIGVVCMASWSGRNSTTARPLPS